jgi:hypothetical protein
LKRLGYASPQPGTGCYAEITDAGRRRAEILAERTAAAIGGAAGGGGSHLPGHGVTTEGE